MKEWIFQQFGDCGLIVIAVLAFVGLVMVNLYERVIAAKDADIRRLESERDNWRRQALEEDERANAAEKA